MKVFLNMVPCIKKSCKRYIYGKSRWNGFKRWVFYNTIPLLCKFASYI